MKTKYIPHLITLSTVICALPLSAERYEDAVIDTAEVEGHRMDIVAVSVTDDASRLHFHIEVADNAGFAADTYARFMVAFDTVEGGNSVANAWHDKVSMPGMDFFGGGWTDAGSGAGMNFYSSALGGWPEWQNGGDGSTWIVWEEVTLDATGIRFGIDLAALGLEPGNSFSFDVTVGWDGGTAVDAIGLSDGTPTQLTGSTPYNSGTNVLTYTVGASTGGETWAGYAVISEDGLKTIDTTSFLGVLEISHAPWVFSYSLDQYIYLPEAQVSESGGWGFVPSN